MTTIVTIAAGHLISNSRADLNTNFANLNSDKIETSVLDTDTALTANSDSKIATQKAVKAYVDTQSSATTVLSKVKFGGSGADGALTITSGTTTVNLGGARVVIKNYTSISITGTGALAFSNPHASGSIVVLKSQGDVTITSSASPAVSVVGMGAAGGTKGTNGVAATAGTAGSVPQPMIVSGLTGGGLGVASASGGTAGAAGAVASPTISTAFGIISRHLPILIGAGGGGGGYGSNNSEGGVGGNGGGCLIIQCSGSYNCSGILSAAGATGGNAVEGSPTPNQSGGGAGGGGGGSLIVLYNTLTSDTGTYTVTGGSGGAGGTAGSSGTGGGGGGGGGSNTAGTIGNAGDASGNGGNGGAGGNGLSYVALNTEFA